MCDKHKCSGDCKTQDCEDCKELKHYNVTVKFEMNYINLSAVSKEALIEMVKEDFKTEYNADITDGEIIKIEEMK